MRIPWLLLVVSSASGSLAGCKTMTTTAVIAPRVDGDDPTGCAAQCPPGATAEKYTLHNLNSQPVPAWRCSSLGTPQGFVECLRARPGSRAHDGPCTESPVQLNEVCAQRSEQRVDVGRTTVSVVLLVLLGAAVGALAVVAHGLSNIP